LKGHKEGKLAKNSWCKIWQKELAQNFVERGAKVGKRSTLVGVAVLVVGNVPGWPPATILALASALKRKAANGSPGRAIPARDVGNKHSGNKLPVAGSCDSSLGAL
jgi:hypothetical protein